MFRSRIVPHSKHMFWESVFSFLEIYYSMLVSSFSCRILPLLAEYFPLFLYYLFRPVWWCFLGSRITVFLLIVGCLGIFLRSAVLFCHKPLPCFSPVYIRCLLLFVVLCTVFVDPPVFEVYPNWFEDFENFVPIIKCLFHVYEGNVCFLSFLNSLINY